MSSMTVRLSLVIGLASSACRRDVFLESLAKTDVFSQRAPSEVDVLLVVDNSFSMAPFQAQLSSGFEPLVGQFRDADVDLHLGVVTTSVAPAFRSAENGCTAQDVIESPAPFTLAGDTFLTLETPDVNSAFADLVKVGVCGDGSEMGMHAAWKLLTSPEAKSSGFLRDEAALSVLVVSDEDDSSPLSAAWYVDDLRKLQGSGRRDGVLFSSLTTVDPANCKDGQGDNATVGARYALAVGATGGVAGDICAADYSQTLGDLSRLSSRLYDTFFLSQEPNAASFKVTVDEVEQPCDSGVWSFQRVPVEGVEQPAIVFAPGHMPHADSTIVIRYDFGTGDPVDFCPSAQGDTP